MADIYAIEIRPDGEVIQHEDIESAKAQLGGVDISTCADRQHVVAVGEWSATVPDPQENYLAWLTYGRSMLYGTAVLWHDDREPVDQELLDWAAACSPLVAAGQRDEALQLALAFWPTRIR